MTRRWFRPADLLIAGVIAAASLAFWLAPAKPAAAVEISADGEVVATLPLSRDATYKLRGVTVRVENGAAFVADADCPDRCCVRAGRLTRPGDVAICLPNRVCVTVAGASDTDGVTY